jgi:hypothetical protein
MLRAVQRRDDPNVPPHRRDFDLVRTEILDADLKPAEVIAVLEELKFTNAGTLRTVRLDEGIRDYLVGALRRHTAG